MFVVLLKFSVNKDAAPDHMEAHKAWLKRGFDDGVFLLAGSLKPQAGGAILAHGVTRDALDALVAQDPFVAGDVVRPEVIEFTPSLAAAGLEHLAGG